MAHAANLSALTDGLIGALTPWTPEKDGRRLRQAKDAATRAFRSQQHPRINQYDIQARLNGLEEKFFILNREPLADALHSRLDELAQRSTRWTPEILSFLLSLSDRPAEKTHLSSLDDSNDSSDFVPQLTWAEIIADDPLTEEGIWDDVVVGSDYSDYSDDGFQSKSDGSPTQPTASTQASSLAEEDLAAFARTFLDSKDEAILDCIEATQSQLRSPRTDKQASSLTEITEFQATRESLSMLKGLPTVLFEMRPGSQVQPQPYFRINSCDVSTFRHLMHDFASVGSQIASLRKLVTSHSPVEILQKVRVAVQSRLRDFDRQLSQIEKRFLSPHLDVVVSLQKVFFEVQRLYIPLSHLATAISRAELRPESWAILDSLFDLSCDLQLCGSADDFTSITALFIECLNIYLRPVHVWMAQGKLREQDGSFFVRSSDRDDGLGNLWRTRFVLAKCHDGAIDAPRFMRSVANQVFIAGKNVMFLDVLRHDETTEAIDRIQISGFDAASIFQSQQDSLLPLAGVFETELQKWIGGLQSHSMRSLREVLFAHCGMESIIDVISHLFLAKDGARFQHFGDELFARMDRNRSWTDRFVLTDLAQSTLGPLKCVDAHAVSLRLSREQATPGVRVLDRDHLARLRIDYTVSWPIRNVIKDFTVCQRAFAVSLRTYRAEYLLTKEQWAVQAVKAQSDWQIGSALALRQRLVWFTGMFRSYISEISETVMQELRADLSTAPDLDSMASAYASFQNKLEAKLLLRKNLRPIFLSIVGLLDMCDQYALLWSQLVEQQHDNTTSSTTTLNYPHKSSEDDSDDSDDESGEEQATHPRIVPTLPNLSSEYERQLHFLIAGLRGVSRVGGEPSWISLAERLQMGVDYANHG